LKKAASWPGDGSRACSIPVLVARIQRPSAMNFQATSATRWSRMSCARPETPILREIMP
jgi:hypothetical protein